MQVWVLFIFHWDIAFESMIEWIHLVFFNHLGHVLGAALFQIRVGQQSVVYTVRKLGIVS